MAKAGKEKKIVLKDDDKDQIEVLAENLKKAQKKKEDAKTNEAKLLAASAIEEAKIASKQVRTEPYCTYDIARISNYI